MTSQVDTPVPDRAPTAGPGRAQAKAPSAARSLPAGLADVALGSATSFVIGIDAARNLDSVSLGLWGLIFSAYLLASVVPTEFLLVPFEAALVSQPSDRQLRSLPRTVAIAALVGVPASVLAMTLAATFSDGVPDTVAGRAALLGVLLGVASPLQDHTRRLMHQAGWSNGAAMVSACQLAVALVAVVGLHAGGVQAIYIPPLALAVSNVGSLAFGLLAALRHAGTGRRGAINLYRATRMGGWLLGAGVADRATQFACLALLSLFLGNAGVGQYEATRVAAQPVLVFALGVLSVYRRPLMRGAQQRNVRGARRATLAYTGLIVAAAAGSRWWPAPAGRATLPRLTPGAFEQTGFLAAGAGRHRHHVGGDGAHHRAGRLRLGQGVRPPDRHPGGRARRAVPAGAGRRRRRVRLADRPRGAGRAAAAGPAAPDPPALRHGARHHGRRAQPGRLGHLTHGRRPRPGVGP
ncbi:MAG: hypothetical protein R2755_23285 [Acidimicrobiales bacterium]